MARMDHFGNDNDNENDKFSEWIRLAFGVVIAVGLTAAAVAACL